MSHYRNSFGKWARKLRAIIREEVQVFAKSIIVGFSGDRKKQHFEVKYNFRPGQKKMRKCEAWELKFRFESEMFTEAKTGEKSFYPSVLLPGLGTQLNLWRKVKSLTKSRGFYV